MMADQQSKHSLFLLPNRNISHDHAGLMVRPSTIFMRARHFKNCNEVSDINTPN
jgi:hypothetical protein